MCEEKDLEIILQHMARSYYLVFGGGEMLLKYCFMALMPEGIIKKIPILILRLLYGGVAWTCRKG